MESLWWWWWFLGFALLCCVFFLCVYVMMMVDTINRRQCMFTCQSRIAKAAICLYGLCLVSVFILFSGAAYYTYIAIAISIACLHWMSIVVFSACKVYDDDEITMGWMDGWIERRSTYMLCKFGESLNISYGNGGSIGLNMDIMCMRVLYVRFFLMVNEKKTNRTNQNEEFLCVC